MPPPLTYLQKVFFTAWYAAYFVILLLFVLSWWKPHVFGKVDMGDFFSEETGVTVLIISFLLAWLVTLIAWLITLV